MAFVGTGAIVARRGLLKSTRGCVQSSFLGSRLPVARSRMVQVRSATTTTTKMSADLNGLHDELMKMYDDVPCQPIMVRLAWHDAGTYHKDMGVPGPDASIRFVEEKGHGANKGLDWAMDKLEPLKKKFPDISYADLYQYASVVAIEHAGGPKIPFHLGRKDATPDDCTPDGRLPDGDKGVSHLRDIFYRMGFNDEEIVVLSGAHTLGKAHKERSGFEGPWTHQMHKFDNSYFKEILKENPDPDLLRLATDSALLSEPRMKELVEAYAKDQNRFFDDYSKAHLKLSELGWDLK